MMCATTMRRLLGACGWILVLAAPSLGQNVMYGCTNDGEFGIVDQTSGAFTSLDTPASGIGNEVLSGITFDASGRVFGTVPSGDGPNGATELIEINAVTGAFIKDIGPIQVSGNDLRINDLATQPGTDVLFGTSTQGPALYTINKTTAVATLVGSIPQRGGLAFAPDGTLYLATVPVAKLWVLNPATGATIGSGVTLDNCIDGLAVRPSDGTLFGNQCDDPGTYIIDKATGDTTLLPNLDDDVTDLAFMIGARTGAPAVSGIGLGIVAAALAGLGVRRLRARG